MLVATRRKPEMQTFRTIRGTQFRVRKVETFTFTVFRSGGEWVEPRSQREENHFVRLQLPCVTVYTTHETLSRNGMRSTLVIRDVRGDYADVAEYLDTVATVATVSHRDGSGMLAELHLTDSE